MPRRPGPSATIARIAVITDVHANLPALQAALTEIDRLGADVTYHTGDRSASVRFQPSVSNDCLSRPSTQLLMGNHDAWFAFGLPDESVPWMTPEEREHQRWVHAQLNPALKSVVRGVALCVVAARRRAATRFSPLSARCVGLVSIAARADVGQRVIAVSAADIDARVLRS